ncbi:hypothetical protein CHLRE_12g540350v5 [Chlamydomonas reinhardtii]|uniref:Cell differentiation protein rcd1 n=1 Tax=Chlamydomonas reinhardtii TaxID=3055 RepID=A0A2K3D6Y2_CHLRE|nr:uncharacterized protein CHLRE_12g540350v5 [Chlamydomonas reinhardtii]PNW76293.1 hypothetical protein CHLRE_12g540350v5 [Chlamydomonas reinhardtii]
MDETQVVEHLVLWLIQPQTRDQALLELSKRRETFPDLACYLWHSFGAIAVLLQEIAATYPMLSPPAVAAHVSNRVCNALALLQCVASHSATRIPFLQANLPVFLYPFLAIESKARPLEYLRLTSLGVIGALVKADETPVISFLLGTEIVPLCLKVMEIGTELSKTVATFIMQKILLDDVGLNYVCATPERFFAVTGLLGALVAGGKGGVCAGAGGANGSNHSLGALSVAPQQPQHQYRPQLSDHQHLEQYNYQHQHQHQHQEQPHHQQQLQQLQHQQQEPYSNGHMANGGQRQLAPHANASGGDGGGGGGGGQPSQRLLKHIIRCYLRLSDNPRARSALRSCLPEALVNPAAAAATAGLIGADNPSRKWLAQLLMNVGFSDSAAALGAPDVVQPSPVMGA